MTDQYLDEYLNTIINNSSNFYLPQVIPIPSNAPIKFPKYEAKNKPIEHRQPPNIVIKRHPILFTSALHNGANSRGKLTNNEAIIPTVCNSRWRSSLIECIRIPNEKRRPSATKWTQNEPKTITQRHDVVWRMTVCDDELSVVLESWRCRCFCLPVHAERNWNDGVDAVDNGGGGGGVCIESSDNILLILIV